MKPARFDYIAPTTLDAAIAALVAADGEGKVMAGGQSLMPLLNFRMSRPTIVVDLAKIPGLSFVEDRGDTRHRRPDPPRGDRDLDADRASAARPVRSHAICRASGHP